MKIINKKTIIIAIIFILIILTVVFLVNLTQPKTEYTTVKAQKSVLVQTVSETGTVKAAEEINLNFLNSGKIANLYLKIGDKVASGQILAELDKADLRLKEIEARANLDAARANLSKIVAGAPASEIAVSQASTDQAKTSYEAAVIEQEKTSNVVNESISQATKNLNDLYLDSGSNLTTYQQARQNYQAAVFTTVESKQNVADYSLDIINTILKDSDARLYLSVKNSIYKINTETEHVQATSLLSAAQASLIKAKADKTDENIKSLIVDTRTTLDKTLSALNNCYSALANSLTGSTFTQTELDAYKTSVSTQQTSVATAISALETAENNYNNAVYNLNNAITSAKNALATAQAGGAQQSAVAQSKVDNTLKAWQVAQAQLNQLKSPARIEDINLRQAQADQAQASLDLVKNQIENTALKAPQAGIITKKNYEIGEQATPAKPVYSMLGVDNFEINIDVSEADISKVNLGNPAEINFDAFGEDIKFKGSVYFIEPAETVIQDVIYYKVKINFDPAGQNVKSGMTANVIITTAEKDNVLVAPGRAIIEKNGGDKYARLLKNNQMVEVPVTLGLRGDEGLIEILSGLSEGDDLVTFIKENN